jgi:hypothetical protein
VRDTVNVLREGVPAVALVHEPFRRLANMAAGQVGMPNAPLLIYPRDLVSEETPEELEAKAREVAEQAMQLLLTVGKA